MNWEEFIGQGKIAEAQLYYAGWLERMNKKKDEVC